jgi:hypothetical protein
MLGAVGGGFLAGAAGFLLPALVTVAIIGSVGLVARKTVQPMASEFDTGSFPVAGRQQP